MLRDELHTPPLPTRITDLSSVGFLQALNALLIPFVAFFFIQNKYALIIAQISFIVNSFSLFFGIYYNFYLN
jgi:hypothetical protein